VTVTPSSVTVPPSAAVDALASRLAGTLLRPSDPGYDAARRLWNGMIDRRPAVIARCATVDDVVACVRFAREHDLPLSVKGGGHGVAGRAICEDGLVIDLSCMSAVVVDPSARTATVGGGATLRALDAAAHAHGLATTAGIYRETGVAGLALGGGVGLLMRRFGLTCDSLLAAEVVTADGEMVTASETELPDLFWALRGGGGNFGVVTRMVFRLYPLTEVLGGRLVYNFADALEVGRYYGNVMAGAPDDLQAYLSYGFDDGGRTASIVFCHCGTTADGEAALEGFRRFRRPITEDVARKPYLAMQQTWDDSFPAGMLRFWKSSFLSAISDDAIRVCQEAIARAELPNVSVDMEPMGGAIARVAPEATAFADRDAASTLLITTGWTDPAESEAHIAWARETFDAIQPYAKPSVYINYLDQGDEHRTEAAYGPNFDRLVAVKRSYDPENRFRPNANIVP
jgi:FAD/FMN-containing dehydrogenase